MSAGILDRRAFILDNTRLLRPPLAPWMQLHLADEAVEISRQVEKKRSTRYIEETPPVVAGRRVLDIASGSGLVAIAAARAGAARVEACEIDDFALVAIALNAETNGVRIETRAADLVGIDEGWDVVLAGDVSYQRDMAEAVTDWLERLAARGADVLIGDPGRSYLARERLREIAQYSVPVTRALEDAEIKKTGVYRFRTD